MLINSIDPLVTLEGISARDVTQSTAQGVSCAQEIRGELTCISPASLTRRSFCPGRGADLRQMRPFEWTFLYKSNASRGTESCRFPDTQSIAPGRVLMSTTPNWTVLPTLKSWAH